MAFSQAHQLQIALEKMVTIFLTALYANHLLTGNSCVSLNALTAQDNVWLQKSLDILVMDKHQENLKQCENRRL